MACSNETASARPDAGHRVIEFGAGKRVTLPAKTACDDYLAVRQQDRRVIRACHAKAARLLETKRSARARLYEHQPHTEKKQRERDPPRNDRKSWPKTGLQGMQCFHSFSPYVFHLLQLRAEPGKTSEDELRGGRSAAQRSTN